MTNTVQKPNVGDLAPDFTLKNQAGQEINLKEELAKNKILLVFYPKDMTSGCTKQLCGIRDIYKEYKNRGIKVYGINHGDFESHQNFIDTYNFPFDILVDQDKKISQLYGAEKLFFKNLVIKRGVFLINQEGKIVYRFWGMQDNEKILELVDKGQV